MRWIIGITIFRYPSTTNTKFMETQHIKHSEKIADNLQIYSMIHDTQYLTIYS